MHAAVVTFPGSNCDRDLRRAFAQAGFHVTALWHKDTALPARVDVVGLPGGFSYGDYLRCGAIAAQSPILSAVRTHVARGGFALGVCNGFQVLCEARLLPGVLMRNARIRFLCRTDQALRVETSDSAFTAAYGAGAEIALPIAHHDGNYQADADTLDRLEAEGRVALRYLGDTPNGAARDIAGVLSANKRVLGLMPHPERAVDAVTGSDAGAALFAGLADALAAA
ncbi:MAG: phosphoribosylformylglycinamidine synthase subunit PurQ [Pseudomonadota bacterium]